MVLNHPLLWLLLGGLVGFLGGLTPIASRPRMPLVNVGAGAAGAFVGGSVATQFVAFGPDDPIALGIVALVGALQGAALLVVLVSCLARLGRRRSQRG